MKLPNCEIDRNAPLTFREYVLAFIAMVSPIIGIVSVLIFCGCAYKGGKIIDGTNLDIGITIPGTEWTINALAYTGGLRVCGNDATMIFVTNEVHETNRYFGCVSTCRNNRMAAFIVPVDTNECSKVASGFTGEIGK